MGRGRHKVSVLDVGASWKALARTKGNGKDRADCESEEAPHLVVFGKLIHTKEKKAKTQKS